VQQLQLRAAMGVLDAASEIGRPVPPAAGQGAPR